MQVEDLHKTNEQLVGDLSSVTNQKQLVDAMRNETARIMDQQRKLTLKLEESDQVIATKDALIERLKEIYAKQGQE